jgi:hypothetical protein
MKFTWNPFAVWFCDPLPQRVAVDQLRVAQLGYLQHVAEAERHSALARMFEQQAVRLSNFREVTIK